MADDVRTRPTPGAATRRPWRSLRVRITAVATAAFTVVFALASLLLLQRVNDSLEEGVREDSIRALAVASPELAKGVDPQTVVAQGRAFDVPLEVRDAQGNLVAGGVPPGMPPGAFVTTDGPTQLPVPPPGGAVGGGSVGGGPAGAVGSTDVLLVQTEAATPAGRFTIVAKSPLDDVRRTIDTLRAALILLVPILAAGVAAIVWFVVSRALRPVEAMRQEVDQISHSTMARRVAEPGSSEEIDRLARTMNEMLDRLESASQQQRQFVSDASHELKTPLATLRSTVEVAMREPNADWTAVGERVLASEGRLELLIDDLLTLARIDEAGPSDVRDETDVDLEELIVAWTSAHREHATSVRVDVSRVVAGRVRGNERELTRVVGNVMDNATRHATDRVEVSLTTSDDGTVVFTVDDDGPGIPLDQRTAVFDRFARLDEARHRDRGRARDTGTGLGLAIVQACVHRHDGSVAIEDAPIGGARVVVVLPATSPGPAGHARRKGSSSVM